MMIIELDGPCAKISRLPCFCTYVFTQALRNKQNQIMFGPMKIHLS